GRTRCAGGAASARVHGPRRAARRPTGGRTLPARGRRPRPAGVHAGRVPGPGGAADVARTMSARRLNVVLLVIDSLRARSLGGGDDDAPRTPFFDRLARETICFREARATECWTLPTHLSMFTGLLPSEHGAHFQTMRYARPEP